MTTMKYSKLVIVSAIVLAAAALLAKANGGLHRGGTDILHLFERVAMVNPGVLTKAAGQVNLGQNQQGHANNQRLDLLVSGLETNAPYGLLALLDDDTNLTPVTDFNTDAKGGADLRYRSVGSSHGHGPSALPGGLNPLSSLRELVVFDNSRTQAVLTADLTVPAQLQYLVKRDLSANGVEVSLRIQATTQHTQFRLRASGLSPASDYFLVVNGGIVETNVTDANGELAISSPPPSPANILEVHTLALWNSASNVVVSTQLP